MTMRVSWQKWSWLIMFATLGSTLAQPPTVSDPFQDADGPASGFGASGGGPGRGLSGASGTGPTASGSGGFPGSGGGAAGIGSGYPGGMGMGAGGMPGMPGGGMSGGGMGGFAMSARTRKDLAFQNGLVRTLEQLKKTTDPEEKKVLLQYARDAFSKRYQEQLKERATTIESLERKLNQLKEDHKRRADATERIVDLQMKSLDLVAEGLLDSQQLLRWGSALDQPTAGSRGTNSDPFGGGGFSGEWLDGTFGSSGMPGGMGPGGASFGGGGSDEGVSGGFGEGGGDAENDPFGN